MEKPLFILPFDHRTSFKKDILGISGDLNAKQKKEIEELKEIVFQGFLRVFRKRKDKNSFAILIDEEFGQEIIKKAKRQGIKICLAVEKSGQKEFDFEYGEEFGKHVKKINPDFVKALVRYDTFQKEINKIQLERLRKLNRFCQKEKYPLIFELLTPITPSESKLEKTLAAVKEIKKEIKVDVWKMEGFSEKEWQEIIEKIKEDSKIIVLGRGEDKEQVKKWLSESSNIKEIIGFAIGRTVFASALKDYVRGKISKEEAIELIAENFNFFLDFWENKKKKNSKQK